MQLPQCSQSQAVPGSPGGGTFHERTGRTLSPSLVLSTSSTPTGTPHQYLSIHWAGFKGAAPAWKKTVRFRNENPFVLAVERRGRRRRVVGLQSAQEHQVQPPSISSLKHQWSPFLLNLSSSLCDPRAQDLSLTPGGRERTAPSD